MQKDMYADLEHSFGFQPSLHWTAVQQPTNNQLHSNILADIGFQATAEQSGSAWLTAYTARLELEHPHSFLTLLH